MSYILTPRPWNYNAIFELERAAVAVSLSSQHIGLQTGQKTKPWLGLFLYLLNCSLIYRKQQPSA